MWDDALIILSISISSIFVVAFVFLGFDIMSSLIVLSIILMVIINLMGMMWYWDIQLNGVTLMNLVVAVGISVEFCSHMTRTFLVTPGNSKIVRATSTLVTMGSSVSKFYLYFLSFKY